MNREEYLNFGREFFGKCLEISEAKNKDYTGGIAKGDASMDGSAFANFTGVEAYGLSTVSGFITRMSDKLQRLRSFDANGTLAVKGESAEDACMDLANYASLCAGYLRYMASKTDTCPQHTGASTPPNVTVSSNLLYNVQAACPRILT